MTRTELLELLTNCAKKFRSNRDHFKDNDHMHDLTETPPQEVVDAVLVGFINHVGLTQGIDYALYTSDLNQP